jgi:hypothetical protein
VLIMKAVTAVLALSLTLSAMSSPAVRTVPCRPIMWFEGREDIL